MSDLHPVDQLARQLHAAAAGSTPTRTRTRLAAARRQLLQPVTPARELSGSRWLVPASIALTALLAVGINQGLQPGGAAPAPLHAINLPLEENPDLYLWLASEPLLAME